MRVPGPVLRLGVFLQADGLAKLEKGDICDAIWAALRNAVLISALSSLPIPLLSYESHHLSCVCHCRQTV